MSKIVNQNITKIFADVDDQIPFIIENINETQTEKVILVLPTGSESFSNVVSLRILSKEILRLNKVVIIQTKDKRAEKLAQDVYLVVVTDLDRVDNKKWQLAEDLKDSFMKKTDSRKRELVSLRQNATLDEKEENIVKVEPKKVNFLEGKKIEEDLKQKTGSNLENEVKTTNSDFKDDFLNEKDNKENYKNQEFDQKVENSFEQTVVKKSDVDLNQISEIAKSPDIEKKDLFEDKLGNKKTDLMENKPLFADKTKEFEPNDFGDHEKGPAPTFEELYNTYKLQKDRIEAKVTQPNKKNFNGKIINENGIIVVSGGDAKEFGELSERIVSDGIEQASMMQKKKKVSITSELSEKQIENHSVSLNDKLSDKDFKTSESLNINLKPSPVKLLKEKVKVVNISNSNFSNIHQFKKTSLTTNPIKFKGLITNNESYKQNLNDYNLFDNRKNFATKPEVSIDKQAKYNSQRLNISRELVNLKNNLIYGLKNIKIKKLVFFPILIFVIFCLVSIFILPTTQITIALIPKSLDFSQNLTAKIGSTDPSTLNLESVELGKEESDTINITNQLDNGTKSSGTVSIYNKSTSPITLPANFVVNVTVGGKQLKYIGSKGGIVPNASQGVASIVYGQLSGISIVAEKTGEDYNITGSQYLTGTIDGFDSSQIVVNFSNNIYGGKTSLILVLDQATKDNLRNKLLNQIQTNLKNELIEKTKNNYILLSEIPDFQIENETYSTPIGTQAENLTATIKIKGVVKGLNKNLIEQTANLAYSTKKLEVLGTNELSEYTQKVSEKFTYSFDILKINPDSIDLKLNMHANLLPYYNSQKVKTQLKGVKINEVLNQVNENWKIISVDFSPKYLPSFLQKVPENFDKIKIVTQEVILN